jgi:hypothetical protein
MTKLLKGKRVFVDTTEFSAAHFNMQNPSFAELRQLCEKRELTLLTTDITKREVQAGIKLLSDKAHQTVSAAVQASNALQEFGTAAAVKALADKLKPTNFFNTCCQAIEKFFNECRAVSLPIPPDAMSKVLDLYFDRRPPFGGGNKKAEFPDAFVLQTLQAAIRPNEDCLYVVSGDSDFGAACQGNLKLVNLKTLSHFLDLVHEHDAASTQVNRTIRKNLKGIEKELESILKSLPPELRDAEGTVTLTSLRLDDILDTLIVSCDGETAAVDFVSQAEVDAVLEFVSPSDDLPEFRNVKRIEIINVTLVFRFDPKDASVFEVLEIWAPSALSVGPYE